MNVNDMWAASCLVLAVIFMILAVLFAVLKEKGAMLIGGFNTLSKEQREEYDTGKMSKNLRNHFILWAGILLAGGILSYLIVFYFAIASLAVWLILFFRDVRLIDKAIGRHREADDQ